MTAALRMTATRFSDEDARAGVYDRITELYIGPITGPAHPRTYPENNAPAERPNAPFPVVKLSASRATMTARVKS